MVVPKSSILLRVELSLHQALRDSAWRNRRSVTGEITTALREWLKKQPKPRAKE